MATQDPNAWLRKYEQVPSTPTLAEEETDADIEGKRVEAKVRSAKLVPEIAQTEAQTDKTLIDTEVARATLTKLRNENKAAEEDKQAGRNEVADAIRASIAAYGRLLRRGGIVNTDDPAAARVSASLASSSLGQFLGGLTGSKNQTDRDIINRNRTAMLTKFKSSEGLGAKMFDSNKDMEMFLAMMGDPKQSIMANLVAMQALDSVYGTGDTLRQALPPALYNNVLNMTGVTLQERGTTVNGKPVSLPEPFKRASPLAAGETPDQWAGVNDTETISSADQRLVDKAQAAFDNGASKAEIMEILGGRVKANPTQIDEAIRYRDKFLKEGGYGPSGAGFMPIPREMSAEERQRVEALNDPFRAFAMGVGNAGSLGLTPDLQSIIDPAGSRKTRESIQMMRENSPWASFAGEAAGSIVPGIGMSSLISKAPRLAKYATELGGITQSAITGAAENPENRLGAAALYGTMGGAGALAGKYAIDPLVQGGMDAAMNRAPKPTFAQRTVAERTGDTAKIEKDLMDAADLGVPTSIADTTPRARMLTRQAGTASEEAANAADAAFASRHLDMPDRAAAGIEGDIAPAVNDIAAKREAYRKRAVVLSDPYYQIANSAEPVADAQLNKVFATQTGREAAKAALKRLENRGREATDVGVRILEDGSVEATNNAYTWEFLNSVNQILRDKVDNAYDSARSKIAAGENKASLDEADSLKDLHNRFEGRAAELNPDFRAAREVYRTAIAPRDFFNSGTKAAGTTVKPGAVEAELRRIAALPEDQQDAALTAYKEGFATSLRDRVMDRSEGANPYAAVFGSKNQQAKFSLLSLKPETLPRQAELEAQILQTGRTMSAAGASEAKNAANQTMGIPAMVGIGIDTLAAGAPIASGASIGYQLARGRGLFRHGLDLMGSGITEQRANDLIPYLMETDPSAALAMLKEAQGAVSDRAAATARPEQISQITGNALGNAMRVPWDMPQYSQDASGDPMSLEVLVGYQDKERERKRREALAAQYGLTLAP